MADIYDIWSGRRLDESESAAPVFRGTPLDRLLREFRGGSSIFGSSLVVDVLESSLRPWDVSRWTQDACGTIRSEVFRRSDETPQQNLRYVDMQLRRVCDFDARRGCRDTRHRLEGALAGFRETLAGEFVRVHCRPPNGGPLAFYGASFVAFLMPVLASSREARPNGRPALSVVPRPKP